MAHILKTKKDLRERRHKRIRAKVVGTETRPRLTVFKSNTAIYAQLVNDETGVTVGSASSLKMKGALTEKAKEVGVAIAKVAKAKGVSAVVFDRSGFGYTGSIKALADSARAGGLEF